ncbi:hypothetical protein CRUP_031950 [Coryphaenoides rupestris]|nr:hypothetical protein CRUP_031950 [Coryphaenoides rupestris]
MEFAPAQLRTFGAANLLGVPGPGPAFSSLDSDDEDCEVVIGIRPKSSPLPRRKTSTSDDESEGVQQQQQTASSQGSRRRVCFADTKGFCLTLVKEFDIWDVPKLQKEAKEHDAERYSYHLTFPSPVPVPPGELGARVREQKIELESVGLLSGTTVLKGLVRVLNVSFDKTGSGDGVTDCFSFRLTLVPPFDERGARVDFCLRYETPVGTFWANNDTKNYVLFCHQRAKESRKSCLKAPRPVTDSHSATSEEERHKLVTENRRNASRRSERRAARHARVNDLFAQRDHGPESEKGDSSCEATLPEPPSDRPREGGLNPVVDSTLDSLSLRSGGSSATDQRYGTPAQSRGSSEAEKSENVNSVDPDQILDRAEDQQSSLGFS